MAFANTDHKGDGEGSGGQKTYSWQRAGRLLWLRRVWNAL